MFPSWIRPLGLVEHLIVGGVLTALLAALGTPALARVIAVAAVGVAHEWGDGDFVSAPGARWNGILDTLALLPVRLVWWALCGGCGAQAPPFVHEVRRRGAGRV